MTNSSAENTKHKLVGRGQRLILASESPRRRELLKQIGIKVDAVAPAEINESAFAGEKPAKLVCRLAVSKADHIAKKYPDSFVLGADTVVACGRRIFPKAESIDQARECLGTLSGRRHRVLGGIAIISPDGKLNTRVVTTTVIFKRLSKQEIESYLLDEEWQNKAGGYAIQGRAATFVRFISGSYSNVVGLPLFETSQVLHGIGFRS